MENWAKFQHVLWALVVQVPSLLTMLACIVAALLRWKRHPKVSLTLIAALSLMIVHMFIFAFVYAFLPELVARRGNYDMVRTVINVISFIYNSSLAVAFGILLLAVFMKRDTPDSLTGTRRSLA